MVHSAGDHPNTCEGVRDAGHRASPSGWHNRLWQRLCQMPRAHEPVLESPGRPPFANFLPFKFKQKTQEEGYEGRTYLLLVLLATVFLLNITCWSSKLAMTLVLVVSTHGRKLVACCVEPRCCTCSGSPN